MKILVTGGLGFIGSNFILILKKRFPSWKITNLDAESFGSNKKNLDQIKKDKNYEYVKGDITNMKLVEKLISQNNFVINFAAESHVDRSINNPESFIKTNYVGTYTILEAIKKYKKTLIQISTDEVFGSLKNQTATENFLYNPSSPYASTKAAAELLIKSSPITCISLFFIDKKLISSLLFQ